MSAAEGTVPEYGSSADYPPERPGFLFQCERCEDVFGPIQITLRTQEEWMRDPQLAQRALDAMIPMLATHKKECKGKENKGENAS